MTTVVTIDVVLLPIEGLGESSKHAEGSHRNLEHSPKQSGAGKLGVLSTVFGGKVIENRPDNLQLK